MDARATREAKREKRKERTCVWAKYRNGRTVRARKKRESARKIHRWKRGARWCGAGCLQRVDSLAFGVARREGHCQCQGGSRQPSRATANRATFSVVSVTLPHICFVILNSLIAAVSHAIFSHCFSPANRCYYRRCIFETVPTANRHPVSGLPLFVSTASPSC